MTSSASFSLTLSRIVGNVGEYGSLDRGLLSMGTGNQNSTSPGDATHFNRHISAGSSTPACHVPHNFWRGPRVGSALDRAVFPPRDPNHPAESLAIQFRLPPPREPEQSGRSNHPRQLGYSSAGLPGSHRQAVESKCETLRSGEVGSYPQGLPRTSTAIPAMFGRPSVLSMVCRQRNRASLTSSSLRPCARGSG